MTTVAEAHKWTFDRQLVRPTRPQDRCKFEGCPGGPDVHPYWTQGHQPVIFPDQWAEGDMPMDGLVSAAEIEGLDLTGFVQMGSHEIAESS